MHRRNMVLRYTVAGFPLDQILTLYNGEMPDPEHQVTLDTLRDDRKAVLQQLGDDFESNRKSYRALLLERADLVLRTLYPAVKAGNLGAIDRWLRTLDLIGTVSGANAPIKVEMSDSAAILSMDERREKLERLLEIGRERARLAIQTTNDEIIDVTPIEHDVSES